MTHHKVTYLHGVKWIRGRIPSKLTKGQTPLILISTSKTFIVVMMKSQISNFVLNINREEQDFE